MESPMHITKDPSLGGLTLDASLSLERCLRLLLSFFQKKEKP